MSAGGSVGVRTPASIYLGDAGDMTAWLDRDAQELAELKAKIGALERRNYELVATVVRLTACVHGVRTVRDDGD